MAVKLLIRDILTQGHREGSISQLLNQHEMPNFTSTADRSSSNNRERNATEERKARDDLLGAVVSLRWEGNLIPWQVSSAAFAPLRIRRAAQRSWLPTHPQDLAEPTVQLCPAVAHHITSSPDAMFRQDSRLENQSLCGTSAGQSNEEGTCQVLYAP